MDVKRAVNRSRSNGEANGRRENPGEAGGKGVGGVRSGGVTSLTKPGMRGVMYAAVVAAAAVAGFRAAHALEAELEWRNVYPEAMSYPQLAYDAARERMVLFNGASGVTWEWTGSHWEHRADTGPSPMMASSMVWHEGLRKTVLFGGAFLLVGMATSGDTWVWDGSQWTLAFTTGPADRAFTAMAYDAEHGQAVVFGGVNFLQSQEYGDTWTWDGSESGWTLRSATGPPARLDHAMAYDRVRKRVVLFGGAAKNGTRLGDTWLWNGSFWARVAQTGPTPRIRAAMAFDAARNRVVLHGGYSGSGFLSDTWEWDGSQWTRILESGPPEKNYSSMVYNESDNCTYLHGQRFSSNVSDTWSWEGTTWTLRQSSAPPFRYFHSMAWNPGDQRTIVFGGYNATYHGHPAVADTWAWDGRRWTHLLDEGPSSRNSYAMACDTNRNRILLFGGWQNHIAIPHSYTNDTWEFDGAKWTRIAETGPSIRMGARMAYDSTRRRMILFGGRAWDAGEEVYQTMDDTWAWHGAEWSPLNVPGPSARFSHAMAYDSSRDRVVVFGGEFRDADNNVTRLGDTWEFDGETWFRIAETGPPPRTASDMAYDSARRRVVLFGGESSGGGSAYPDDTWEWDGMEWTMAQLDPGNTPPFRRADHALAYDFARKRVVLFGGWGDLDSVGDTWELATRNHDLFVLLGLWDPITELDINSDGALDIGDVVSRLRGAVP